MLVSIVVVVAVFVVVAVVVAGRKLDYTVGGGGVGWWRETDLEA